MNVNFNRTLILFSLVLLTLSQLLLYLLFGSEGATTFQLWILGAIIFFSYIIGSFMLLKAGVFGPPIASTSIKPGVTPFNVICGGLILVNVLLVALHLFSIAQSTYHLSKLYIFRPDQKFEATVPSRDQTQTETQTSDQDLKTYVYWIHVKGVFESDCCIGDNPTLPTTDTSKVFSLKSDNPDPRGYEGVVCSPDCNGNTVWSGPVIFSESEPPSHDVRLAKLTPSGPVSGTSSQLSLNFANPSVVYEIVVKKPGCVDNSCIVKTKTISDKPANSSIGHILDQKDNILPITTYDIVICSISCQKNPPRVSWNPRSCISNSLGMIFLFIGDHPSNSDFDRCD